MPPSTLSPVAKVEQPEEADKPATEQSEAEQSQHATEQSEAEQKEADKPQEFLLPVGSPTSSASEASEAEKPPEPVGPPRSFGPFRRDLDFQQLIETSRTRFERSLQEHGNSGRLPNGGFAMQ